MLRGSRVLRPMIGKTMCLLGMPLLIRKLERSHRRKNNPKWLNWRRGNLRQVIIGPFLESQPSVRDRGQLIWTRLRNQLLSGLPKRKNLWTNKWANQEWKILYQGLISLEKLPIKNTKKIYNSMKQAHSLAPKSTLKLYHSRRLRTSRCPRLSVLVTCQLPRMIQWALRLMTCSRDMAMST